MSFREKSAWISLGGILLVGGYVAYWLMNHPGAENETGAVLGLIVGAIVVQTIIAIVATVGVAIAAPREASAPRDERDKLIELRATQCAYLVLLIAALAIANGYFFSFNGYALSMAALAAVAVAEAVRFLIQIAQYRLGA